MRLVESPMRRFAWTVAAVPFVSAVFPDRGLGDPSFNGHTYMLTSQQYFGVDDDNPNPDQPDWLDAEAEAVAQGCHLVTVNDQAENQWLVATFGTNRWIGFTDLGSEGTFHWISGEASGFTNWQSGQPDNVGGEDSAHLTAGDGQWNDLGNPSSTPGLAPMYGIIECNPGDLGTAFTYQGSLENGGGPVTDTCDFRFGLWDDEAAGSEVGDSPHTVNAVAVTEGVFTTTVDFGPGSIDGTARWLEIEVQCPGDAGFVLLEPRVELTPTPHAIRASEGVGPPNALEVDQATGKVGIGTTTPTEALDVVGTAQVTALKMPTGAAAGRVLTSDATGLAAWLPATVSWSGITGGPFDSASSIVAWGDNGSGQTNVPAPNADFIAVAAGFYHSLGLKSDGSIVGWGGNFSGQTDVPAPNADFIAIAVGGGHSLGLKSDGSIVAWGYNVNGQTNVPAPNADFIAIAAGGSHSLGLKSDGSIVAWGDNGSGQTDVPGPNADFIAVAAGRVHSLGLKSDSAIVAWGWNGSGQTDVPVPSADFIAIAAGGSHSLGLKSDGTIVAWGWNVFGQTDVPAPNADFIAVAGGGYHSLGLKSDGSIVAWGAGQTNTGYFPEYGQSIVPAPNADFIAIAAGDRHSLGVRQRVSVPRLGIGRHAAANALEVEGDASKTVAGDWLANSDRRIKTRIRTITNALDAILRVRPVAFRYTAEYKARHPSIQDRDYYNYIAQEFREVFPEWVQQSGEDGLLQMDSYPASVYSVAAIQELHWIVQEKNCEIEELREQKSRELSAFRESLDSEISNLKSEIAELKALVNVLTKQNGGGR